LETRLAWIEASLLVLLIVGFAAGATSYAHILRVIRGRHEAKWKEMGSPTLIRNNSIASNRRMRSFMQSGEFEVLGDSSLSRSVRRHRVIERVYIMIFVLFAIHFFVDLYSTGQ